MIPTEIENEIIALINNGTFAKNIDAYGNQLGAKITRLEARFNAFTALPEGSTSGDGELMDARTGYDGYTHINAGTAIREQYKELFTEYQEIMSTVCDVSKSNIIKILKVVRVTEQDTMTIEYDREKDVLVFNGNTNVVTKFDVYVDGGAIDNTEYPLYIMFDTNFVKEQGITSGLEFTFTDGTTRGPVYSNVNHFHELTDTGKKLAKITFVFAAGYRFNNMVTRFYTAHHVNGSFEVYQAKYTPKDGFERPPMTGKKILTYGDSMVGQNIWQPVAANLLNCTIIEYGFGGYPLALAQNPVTGGGYGLAMDYQIENLITKITEEQPDILLIMGGTNDWGFDGAGNQSEWNEIHLGDVHELTITTYKGGLCRIVREVLTAFPNLDVFIMSPIGGTTRQAGKNLTEQPKNNIGYVMSDFAEAARETARFLGVGFIDTFACGITVYNSSAYISDGVHLKRETGGPKVGQYVANNLLNHYTLKM